MANIEHVELVKSGAREFAIWRTANLDVRLDLSRANFFKANLYVANLSGAKLNEANLNESKLGGANLNGADLDGANLIGADLSAAELNEAKLSGANLRWADLTGASLIGADLIGTNLIGANLSEADLIGAKLNRAICDSTTFVNNDLSETIGLREVRHSGPSSIGVDTLYKSRGMIPEEFLRGCGVPDGLITYLPSLLGAVSPIEFYSCFISYSHKDEEFCKRLYSRMRDEKLRVWYAPEDMQGGKKIHEQIDQAIRMHDKLLLVLSKKSMSSEWVATEIYHARQREIKEKRKVLFPIRLVPFEAIRDWKLFDADSGKDLAREIREYLIPDFTNWKDHDAFEAGFAKLMKDLRAAEFK